MLESQFPEVAENQPELLARHFADAGMIEKAASLWGKAGQRSLERSAHIEAEAQFKRALDGIAALPGEPRQRREQIKLQVGLAKALMQTKGFASPETKAAFEQTRIFVERAEALGESLEDPLVLFSVLFGFWMANFVAFNADAVRELAAECLSLAQKHGAAVPLVLGHSLLGAALVVSGDFAEGQAHLDRANALYDPAEHSQLLSTRFGLDFTVFLPFRASAHWTLGRPEAARADVERALGRCAQDWPPPLPDGGAAPHGVDAAAPGRHRGGEGASRRTCRIGGRKGGPGLQGSRNGGPKLRACLERRSLEGCPVV